MSICTAYQVFEPIAFIKDFPKITDKCEICGIEFVKQKGDEQ